MRTVYAHRFPVASSGRRRGVSSAAHHVAGHLRVIGRQAGDFPHEHEPRKADETQVCVSAVRSVRAGFVPQFRT